MTPFQTAKDLLSSLICGLAGGLMALACVDPEPPAPNPLVGGWVMHWDGTPWDTEFHATGAYACTRAGDAWLGKWTFDTAKRELSVEETHQATMKQSRWSTTLDKSYAGTPVYGWVSFSLERRKKL